MEKAEFERKNRFGFSNARKPNGGEPNETSINKGFL
jgi:hypothetical protein